MPGCTIIIAGKKVAIIFYGTTHVCEAFVIVVISIVTGSSNRVFVD